MRELMVASIILGVVLLLHLPAGADVEMPDGVVANGGGRLIGANYNVGGCTVGQSAIGLMSGSSNVHHAGFWRPAMLLTPVPPDRIDNPVVFRFGPPHPNPFNPVTTFRFSIPRRSHITLKVFDVKGREVRTLVDEELGPGRHSKILDAEGLASGIYFARMVVGSFVATEKIVLLK